MTISLLPNVYNHKSKVPDIKLMYYIFHYMTVVIVTIYRSTRMVAGLQIGC